jgi:DNA-binding transcriptional MocR family regulator
MIELRIERRSGSAPHALPSFLSRVASQNYRLPLVLRLQSKKLHGVYEVESVTADIRVMRWVRKLEPAEGPYYLQIAAMIEGAVAEGRLQPGDRLPPQRTLASHLGVDLTTVTRAYSEARQRHLLDAVTGRGSFIASGIERSGPPIDLGMNIPPAPKGVRLVDLMQRGIADLLGRSNVDILMTYQVGPGAKADRAAGAAWLEPLLGPVDPKRIVVSPGAQPAILALLRTLAPQGGAILTEPLTYPGLLAAARLLDLKVVAVETDDDGIIPDSLEKTARATGSKIICLTPTIQNPTTTTMPLRRRKEIARLAEKLDLKIIEDDPYALLAGDAPAPLAALAPNRTYYISTVSKVLTPGLRTAFIALPPEESADRLLEALRAAVLMPAPLMSALLTHWIQTGAAADILNGVRAEAQIRQKLAAEILPKNARAHPSGIHVWLPLPQQWERFRLVEMMRREGLGVTASDAFSVSPAAPDAIRISLGGVTERARLAEALKAIRTVLGGDNRSRQMIV